MIEHIILSNGDAALVVNDHLVMTAEAGLDFPDHVERVAENLATALDLPLSRVEWQEPYSEDWTWEGLLEEIQIARAADHTPAQR